LLGEFTHAATAVVEQKALDLLREHGIEVA
jgi:hypothetical protein